MSTTQEIKVTYVPIGSIKAAIYNPRKWSKEQLDGLIESIKRFGICDPLIANSAPARNLNLIGGHMRLAAMKTLNYSEVPVVFVDIPNEEKERELNLRLNRNTGEFDLNLLAEFDPSLLSGIGFTSEELDDIFPADEHPEVFDLAKELSKLDIKEITVQKGDRYDFGEDIGVVMCGNSMIEADMLALMNGEKSDMCMTDPPYLLDYLKGKKKSGKTTEGFGLKRDRTYLGTTTLPDNFTELWMANVARVAKQDFSIMIFENPKNLRTIWNEMEKHWKYRNTITWRLPNRTQGFSAKYKFFNKTDIAVLGTGETFGGLNLKPEEDVLLESEYENALFATSGKPHWEAYEKGKKICPTDFIDYKAADEKSSGQGIIFGTKPVEILLPYLKVLTKRGDLVLEPFGGSGSTAAASFKLKRRFRLMEKSEVYTAVILKRLEKLTGVTPKKI
jgi:DNA modification methylase